jgi:hypothetical protein
MMSSDAAKLKTAATLAKELEQQLTRGVTKGNALKLQHLLDDLESWTKKKKGVMSGVFAALSGSVDSAVATTEELLVREGVWEEGERHKLAVFLIRNGYDSDSQAHCSTSCAGEEEMFEHKMSCPFRPMTCENAGCPCSFSLRQHNSHDARCVYKLIPCILECGESVERRLMQEHTLGTCAMKGVLCPYHDIGCTAPVRQGDLNNHLINNAENHLRMLYASELRVQKRVEDIERWATALTADNEKRLHGLQAMDVALLTLETKHLELGKEYTVTKATTKTLENKVKTLESSQSSTDKVTKSLEGKVKALEAAASKQNAEVATLKKTIDNLVKSLSSGASGYSAAR